ncbi:MAG: right-handed parallel beta-helix repeat-containing protein, partial [Planctomycetota bacterium]
MKYRQAIQTGLAAIVATSLLEVMPSVAHASDDLQQVSWEDLPDHLAWESIPLLDVNVTDCPAVRAFKPSYTVAQYIENTFYVWEEYYVEADGGTPSLCIVLREPHAGPLSEYEAQVLLTASDQWPDSYVDLEQDAFPGSTFPRLPSAQVADPTFDQDPSQRLFNSAEVDGHGAIPEKTAYVDLPIIGHEVRAMHGVQVEPDPALGSPTDGENVEPEVAFDIKPMGGNMDGSSDAEDAGERPGTLESAAALSVEGFEFGFPGAYWFVTDENDANGLDYWDEVSCNDAADGHSAWCADIGNYTADCGLYDNNMDAYMFVEATALWGDSANPNNRLYYWRWGQVEDGYDWGRITIEGYDSLVQGGVSPAHGLNSCTSPDVTYSFGPMGDTTACTTLCANCLWDNHNGRCWESFYIEIPWDLFHDMEWVRVIFRFHSNGSNRDEGIYFDDIEFNDFSYRGTNFFPISGGFPSECCSELDCDDGNPCTADECVLVGDHRVCQNPSSTECDDGVYCNGPDFCSGGICSVHAGNPCPGPDGDSDCSETCNELANDCTANDPNGSACNDGVYCNGTDTCSGGGCSQHAGNPCPGPDGDNDCSETCDESADNCKADDPNNSACDDGLWCTGSDTCTSGNCLLHAGNPCPGPDGDGDCSETCNESANNCTANDPDYSACADGLWCNGTDTCFGGNCAQHTGDPWDPCPGPDGDNDCSETCNEGADDCTWNDIDGSACNDGAYCNGADTCSGGTCSQHAGDPCIDPPYCDEVDDICLECVSDSDCNDGDPCTADTCDGSGLCLHNFEDPGTPCGDPSDTSCDNPDTCDGLGACLPNLEGPGTSCDDGVFCTFADQCDGVGGCFGWNVNTVPCTTAFDCEAAIGVAFDCVGGFCFCVRHVFVDGTASGENDGSSWADAFNDLQDALDTVLPGDEIWVAEGIYKPDEGLSQTPGDRLASFAIAPGVELYGGFPLGGGTFEERDPVLYQTVLSGDIDENDGPDPFQNNGNNSCHVVTAYCDVVGCIDPSAVIDGFTISGGRSDDPDICVDRAAGMFVQRASPTIRNCAFVENWANVGGGLVLGNDSTAVVIGCQFIGNRGQYEGGGLFTNSSPTVLNSIFLGNTSGHSGASQGGTGSGAYMRNSTNASSNRNGAGMYVDNSAHVTLINATFSQNTASVSGGGLGIHGSASATVVNSIFWNNSDAGGTDESAQIHNNGTLLVDYSCIQGLTGGLGGIGNISDDPQFVDADGNDNTPGTPDDDLRLSAQSLSIDAGDTASLPQDDYDLDDDGDTLEDLPIDLGGNPRVANSSVDQGAYEYKLVPPDLPADWEHQAKKHRYLSIDPTTNPRVNTAIKVEVAEMRRCQNAPTRGCMTDSDCDSVCDDVAGDPPYHTLKCPPADCSLTVPPSTCIASGPCV